ncbi:hypothetical protein DC3_40160 [Deinococcus cellulosilyticus NBRC 106333 = KACC 11606]|uniref:Uncharacterized protein n=1 Tax=Deinococcus cellulosilyticus (strain DSM 18568 / NBRC 106333 / KACC 11606 / 5516J-15) TaxID=1223518 RepID=A0A511N7J1_DEIC1|nr:hypothetical protein DC3_40160 [Deinococcus cellulosilyticus NBRC 106333 = KACC 11606]
MKPLQVVLHLQAQEFQRQLMGELKMQMGTDAWRGDLPGKGIHCARFRCLKRRQVEGGHLLDVLWVGVKTEKEFGLGQGMLQLLRDHGQVFWGHGSS